jgi:hypothetical protein
MSDTLWASLISIVPTLLVLLGATVLLINYRVEIRRALSSLVWRLKSGAYVKVSSFELGATYIDPKKGEAAHSNIVEVKKDKGDARYNERGKYYKPNRDVFLVHRIKPSNDPNELYDIELYLLPHKSASLVPVQRVEYYFGKYWHDRIFVSTDRSSGFLVSTSAYGPFVCTAEVHFTDGDVVMLSRYVDFEMGSIGR